MPLDREPTSLKDCLFLMRETRDEIAITQKNLESADVSARFRDRMRGALAELLAQYDDEIKDCERAIIEVGDDEDCTTVH